MRRFLNIWSRKLHRWGAILVLVPIAIVITTGLLLQVKKQWSWVQPPEQQGVATVPTLSLDELVSIARAQPEAEIAGWDDVRRIDVRPADGMAKVLSRSGWEIQVDAATGDVLQVARRRSDLIESLHDGSYFASWTKLGVFLPAGLILLILWLTGAYLWILPIVAKRSGKRRRSAQRG